MNGSIVLPFFKVLRRNVEKSGKASEVLDSK